MEHNLKINYLYHSGFTVETNNYLLIFDYFKDHGLENKSVANGFIGKEDLETKKKIIVFSSHSHHDHFNPIILDWINVNKAIQYVFSSDIVIDKKEPYMTFLSPYDSIILDDLNIKAYGSTDLGVSFLVKVDESTIFHAGDLNWWYWWDDTEEEIAKAEKWFKEEIDYMKDEKIDVAFFPVDQRLEQNYALGAKYFIDILKPKYLIPMHFGDHYETTVKFALEMKNSLTNIFTLNSRGQEIKII
ncbi:L-ascorbate metabolism protein UlaG (beta-lactamase superfamily) [Natranaerovirga pectinivora]|uniref:L-ascorbate metabolism protein UlaG (Beta-lactamase superfamily) n=1 Tax=Natranaerovirga pectinivora TaxID=682400 RepID=A0A4R3MRC0_9FIRM|nr:MBL fold metallo-hydrolase [Natranaerovirga pectinivora]TCT15317.1 L-ascorbate metabolism protein UlaG (beta-lactamase superfamily) [Natranaerovirga pectinivora]